MSTDPARCESSLAKRPSGPDGEARFDAFWRENFPRLVSSLRSTGLDGEAEDIAQETLVRAFQRRGELDFSLPMQPWLRTVASRLRFDGYERQRRSVPTDPAEMPDSPKQAPNVDERLAVSQALRLLPKRQRRAVELAYFEDRDPTEAARILGLNRTSFNQLLYRARLSFKSAYRRIGEGASGLVAVPLRRLRRVWGELVGGIGRVAARPGKGEGLLSVTAQQFATGLAALLIAVGANAGEEGPLTPSGQPRPVTDTLGVTPAEPRPPTGGGAEDVQRQSIPEPQRYDSSPSVERPAAEKANAQKLIDDIIQPNHDVTQPEDASITSIVHSPRFSEDRTLFASGITRCRGTLCPSVVFRSTDGGASWSKLEGRHFYGVDLMLPPAFGAGDDRIFAMGPSGLQVSEDGGQTFLPAAVAGANQAIGSAAISPAFNDGDPTILIGAQTLMRYRDDLRTVEAAPSTAVPGPLEPAYPPGYMDDRRVLIGGLRFDPSLGRAVATMFTCSEAVCESTVVSSDQEAPRIRFTPEYPQAGGIHAFTPWGIFVADSPGQIFRELSTPWASDVPVSDLAVEGEGGLFAAVNGLGPPSHPDAGLYHSHDGGKTWERIPDPLFEGGATLVMASPDRVLVGLGNGGIACSQDGGIFWSRRCR